MWNLAPPPGFQGLREDLPLSVSMRHMPHWRQPGATYFVTFRLADALPQNRILELQQIKEEWERSFPAPRSNEELERLARMVFERVENWLDQGSGDCLLREQPCAKIVADSLRHFHGSRYELGCIVVMPNHVHVIVRPLGLDDDDLNAILKSWKSFTARRINEMLGRAGPLWQEESYDRIIRDPEHLWRTIQYLGRNPWKAGLQRDVCQLWINPGWERLGWKFE
jgi:REP element-mobilizing transposase RayT